jgi:hypothetical protein
MAPEDPWKGGGKATRAEVREIFARHEAARRSESAASGPGERHSAVPGFLSLPARGWSLLSSRGRAVVVAVAAALVALVAVLLPPALETASENRVKARSESAANRERIRRELVEQQRPHRARLDATAPVAAALAEVVGADARRRVGSGTLDGPVGHTSCRPVRRRDGDPAHAVYTCLVERARRGGAYRDRDIVIGYRFRARVELATGAAVWCKESPPPLHGDQEEFVKVPVSQACTG